MRDLRRGGRLGSLRNLPWLAAELLRAGPRIGEMQLRLEQLDRRHAELEQLVETELRPILRALLSEEAANRRRLQALRADPDYARPFEERDPLVSITVATPGRAQLLRERSLPSILAQTHAKLDVVVVGDHAGPETEEAVAALGDERLSYRNLTQRTVAHDDPAVHWFVQSTMARNEANRLARGSWLVTFDDDDAMRPNHVETLLTAAREQRVEVAYGGYRTHLRDGSAFDSGGFPPAPKQLAWPAAIQHGGLRFFERELAAVALRMPGDWFLLERMLRAGVSFGYAEEIVLDYYPSLG